MTPVAESTPLLSRKKDETNHVVFTTTTTTTTTTTNGMDLSTKSQSIPIHESNKFPILLEVIGARNLPATNMLTYCVIQYGVKTIHRTKPYIPKIGKAALLSQAFAMNRLLGKDSGGHAGLMKTLKNPIWTIQEDALTTFLISKGDMENKKLLKITIWGQPRQVNLKDRAANVVAPKRKIRQLESIGKIQLPASMVLKECHEERLELPLTDDLGNAILDSNGEPSTLAIRCRIATMADLKFVEHWEKQHEASPEHWKDAGIIQSPNLTRVPLLTELPDPPILSTAPTGKARPLAGHVRVKPYPNPNGGGKVPSRYISPAELKTQTILPSSKWIQAGSQASSHGRLYLEILSAHGLPNVDVGGSVGNETDAFCAVVYGDAMVQTDVIYDELSPHWPCWSQRAFVFHMQHPSQVLYLAVFGYKRNPLPHRPIGRVEVNPVNLQTGTVYNLEYNLCGQSHAAERQSRGRIRIRVRMEIDNQRKWLLAALKPPPPVYINTTKKKSVNVARYTACGEYDNEENFNLHVLQGYIDEITEGYIRRIVYALQDGTRSLLCWRDQIQICGVGFPLYSLLTFAMAILLVEHPRLFPAFVCFAIVAFFMNGMQQRLSSPSPWRRCFSFTHYLQILLLGKSIPKDTSIEANQGADELQAQDEALRERIAQDKKFMEKKEAIEKEIEEIANFKVHTDSKLVPVELLVVLGKVQGIVGGTHSDCRLLSKQMDILTFHTIAHTLSDVCRICRFIDAIVTWEESDLAFFLTLALLLVGLLFLVIPWGFLLHWTGRILVVLLLGPQNRILDSIWFQKVATTDQQIYKLFAERMFEARCKHEEALKLKAFRHFLYGKYATRVPPLLWSPHMDFPLPASTACTGKSQGPERNEAEKLPLVVGQQLHGKMIPRPEDEWKRNVEEQVLRKELVDPFLAELMSRIDTAKGGSSIPPSPFQRDGSMILEEGFEITDLFDEEARYVENAMEQPANKCKQEQDMVVVGCDTANKNSSEPFVPVWKSIAPDIENGLPQGVESDDLLATTSSCDPVRIPTSERKDMQSMIELGFEVTESKDEDEQSQITISHVDSQTMSGSIPRLQRHERWFASSDLTGITIPKPTASSLLSTISQDNSTMAIHTIPPSNPPLPIPVTERRDRQSTIELGIEVTDSTDEYTDQTRARAAEQRHEQSQMPKRPSKQKTSSPAQKQTWAMSSDFTGITISKNADAQQPSTVEIHNGATTVARESPIRIPTTERMDRQSMIELGIEITESMEEEA